MNQKGCRLPVTLKRILLKGGGASGINMYVLVMINQRKRLREIGYFSKMENKDDRWLCTILSYCLLKTSQTTTPTLSPLLGETWRYFTIFRFYFRQLKHGFLRDYDIQENSTLTLVPSMESGLSVSSTNM